MKIRISFLFFLLFIISPAAFAVPVVLDFVSGGDNITTPYEEDGFIMSVNSGHYDFLSAGSPGFGYLNIDISGPDPVSSVRFELIDTSLTFDLLSVHVIDDPRLMTAKFESSAGGVFTFESPGDYTFSGLEWSNLSWLDFSTDNGYAGIDFLTFDVHIPVTEPNVVGLLAIGLLLISSISSISQLK